MKAGLPCFHPFLFDLYDSRIETVQDSRSRVIRYTLLVCGASGGTGDWAVSMRELFGLEMQFPAELGPGVGVDAVEPVFEFQAVLLKRLGIELLRHR